MADYEVVPFPQERRMVGDIGWLARHAYAMLGLVEVDVSEARQRIEAYRVQTGERLSFTAFLIVCIAHAVDQHKMVQACQNWRGQLVIFADVDVGMVIEVEVGGQKFPVGHIVRAANKKTLRQIHDEIRAVQARPAGSQEVSQFMRGTALPALIRRAFMWLVMKRPLLRQQFMGTVALTSVGMFVKRGGWAMAPMPTHTLGIFVGGIAEKPGVVDGRIEIREYLDLTIEIDHDIVDGAPAARFGQCLIDLVEHAYGLGDDAGQNTP